MKLDIVMHISLCSVLGRYVVITSSQTLLKRKVTGKKDQRPSSNLGPTLFRGVSATRAIGPSCKSLVSHCLMYVPVVGVPLYSNCLKTYASRLVQCVMVMGSAGLGDIVVGGEGDQLHQKVV